ncbi:MAG: hypothetical protein HC836_44875 [Richelia sp. RM2_1_2]|nr:hypothetical protein [Richelia sp. RM2_1_2]
MIILIGIKRKIIYDEYEYDYRCPHCGNGYYADVGMGPLKCPSCGELLGVSSNDKKCSIEDYAVSMADYYKNIDLEYISNSLKKETKEVQRLIADVLNKEIEKIKKIVDFLDNLRK